MTDDELRDLVIALLRNRWDVELVVQEDGSQGAAILLDGWYRDPIDHDAREFVAAWQGRLDALRDAVGLEANPQGGDWSGLVVKE